MHIRGVEMRNWTVHKATQVSLPEKGIVLVTGANGKGKSSLPEAIAMALWGESLRGKAGWTPNPGQLIIHAPPVHVDRRRVNGKSKLQFQVDATDSVEYDTASKAQEALDQIVGSFDVWRYSHAFSSRDASNFSEAGDADRKRLIETVLGFSRFDAAARLCRADLRGQEQESTSYSNKLALYEERIRGITRAMATALAEVKQLEDNTPAPLPSLPKEFADTDAWRKKIQEAMRNLSKEQCDLGDDISQYNAEAKQHQRLLELLTKCATCPTCQRSIEKKYAVAEGEKLLAQIKALEDQAAATRSKKVKITAQLENVKQKSAAFQEEMARRDILEAKLRSHSNELKEKQGSLREVERELLDVQDEQDEARALLHGARGEVSILKQVEKVLSTTGVRAHLLHDSLAFIEQTANVWLERIAGEKMKLRLTPYSESSKGDVRDVIGMEVEGAGGGLGYKAASGGERRRIDIGLMLALAEVSLSMHNAQAGTMFFDEVFDALDVEGVAAVCDVLDELADTRAIILISHNEDVVKGVRNVVGHLRF